MDVEDELVSAIESWPVALALLQLDRDAAGNWRLLAVNRKMRETLNIIEARPPGYYDWLRAFDDANKIREWIRKRKEPTLQASGRNFARLDFGHERFGVMMGSELDGIDWPTLSAAILDEFDIASNYQILAVDNDGRAIAGFSQLSGQIGKGKYLDQWLPAKTVENAYKLLDTSRVNQETADDVRLRRIGPKCALLITPEPGSVKKTEEQLVCESIINGLDGKVLFVDETGRICACSKKAEEFWRRPIAGHPVDEFLEPEKNGFVTFYSCLKEKSSEDIRRMKVWASIADGDLTRVRVTVRKIDTRQGQFSLLSIRAFDEVRGTEQTIHNLAHFDPLTGLPNRQLFIDRLGNAIEDAKRLDGCLSIMILDVDRFQLINDSLGLETGDAAIKAISERLRGALGRGDTLARSAADEFLLLSLEPNNADQIARLAKNIQAEFKKPVVVPPHEFSISLSVGIALFPHDGKTPGELLRNADTALGKAKRQGRNVCQFFTEDMNAAAFERLMLENRLRSALQNDEMQVYYQPQVSTESGRIVGVEALIRWFHPELGMISPGEFIPLAEETGLIIPIGNWALEEACRQVKAWHKQGHDGLRLAVNLSALQFEHEDLQERILSVLRTTGLPISCLELEVTESVVMRNAEATIHKLKSLDTLGIGLAVDDFGTGYSSLAYLKRFPLRCLKIDRSFVGDVDHDSNSLAIVQAIVALGNALNIKLVAEGVETREQLEKLCQLGCSEMQGYLFSRPLPADDVGTLLGNHRLLNLAT